MKRLLLALLFVATTTVSSRADDTLSEATIGLRAGGAGFLGAGGALTGFAIDIFGSYQYGVLRSELSCASRFGNDGFDSTFVRMSGTSCGVVLGLSYLKPSLFNLAFSAGGGGEIWTQAIDFDGNRLRTRGYRAALRVQLDIFARVDAVSAGLTTRLRISDAGYELWIMLGGSWSPDYEEEEREANW